MYKINKNQGIFTADGRIDLIYDEFTGRALQHLRYSRNTGLLPSKRLRPEISLKKLA
jgi:hypothetical protein